MSDHFEATPIPVPELVVSEQDDLAITDQSPEAIGEQEKWHRPSIKEIWHMTDADRDEGGRLTKIAVGAMVTGLCVEWFGPNEIAITNISDNTYKHSHSILHAATNAGIFSFSLQTAVGLTVALGLSRFPKTIENLRERMKRPEPTQADRLLEDTSQEAEVNLLTETDGDTKTKSTEPFEKKTSSIGSLALRGVKETGKPLLEGSALNLAFKAPYLERSNIPLNSSRVLGWSAIVGAGVFGVVAGSLKLVQETEIHNVAVNEVNVLVNDILPNPIGILAIAGLVFGTVKLTSAAIKKVSPPIKSTYNSVASMSAKGIKAIGKIVKRRKAEETKVTSEASLTEEAADRP